MGNQLFRALHPNYPHPLYYHPPQPNQVVKEQPVQTGNENNNCHYYPHPLYYHPPQPNQVVKELPVQTWNENSNAGYIAPPQPNQVVKQPPVQTWNENNNAGYSAPPQPNQVVKQPPVQTWNENNNAGYSAPPQQNQVVNEPPVQTGNENNNAGYSAPPQPNQVVKQPPVQTWNENPNAGYSAPPQPNQVVKQPPVQTRNENNNAGYSAPPQPNQVVKQPLVQTWNENNNAGYSAPPQPNQVVKQPPVQTWNENNNAGYSAPPQPNQVVKQPPVQTRNENNNCPHYPHPLYYHPPQPNQVVKEPRVQTGNENNNAGYSALVSKIGIKNQCNDVCSSLDRSKTNEGQDGRNERKNVSPQLPSLSRFQGIQMQRGRAPLPPMPPLRLPKPHVHLQYYRIWREFADIGNEIVLKRRGRNGKWESNRGPVSKDELDSSITYTHPMSNCTGKELNDRGVCFHHIRLSNHLHVDDKEVITLKTLRKYQAVLEIIEVDKSDPSLELNKEVFETDETTFIAVSLYYSDQLADLKIRRNPFSSGMIGRGRIDRRKMAGDQEMRTQEAGPQNKKICQDQEFDKNA